MTIKAYQKTSKVMEHSNTQFMVSSLQHMQECTEEQGCGLMDDMVKFTQKMSNVYIAKKAYEFLVSHDVLVGIPQETSPREGEDVTNAELLFIHTNGSPIRNIRPRMSLGLLSRETMTQTSSTTTSHINNIISSYHRGI